MTQERDWDGNMRRHHLDEPTAERLLAGALSPADAPHEYAGVAGLFQAAAGPAQPAELAAEASVVAAGVAALCRAPTPLTTHARRNYMLGKLLTAKAGAAVAVVALGAGTAAAAISGTLPTSAEHHANKHATPGLSTAASHLTTPATAPGTTRSTPPAGPVVKTSLGPAVPSVSPPTSLPTTGPANTNALFGLCTAFLAKPGVPASSARDTSTAFSALIAETGGTPSATESYCTTYVEDHAPAPTTDTSTTTDHAEPRAVGTGASPSVGNVTEPHPNVAGATGADSHTPHGASTDTPSPGDTNAPPDVTTGRPPSVGDGHPASPGPPSTTEGSSPHPVVPTPGTVGTGTADTADGADHAGTATTTTSTSGGHSTSGSANDH